LSNNQLPACLDKHMLCLQVYEKAKELHPIGACIVRPVLCTLTSSSIARSVRTACMHSHESDFVSVQQGDEVTRRSSEDDTLLWQSVWCLWQSVEWVVHILINSKADKRPCTLDAAEQCDRGAGEPGRRRV